MRLAVKVSDELDAKITKYATSFGMTKSAFMCYCIGQHIRDLEVKESAVGQVLDTLKDSVKESSSNAPISPLDSFGQ